jgi:hypothetical protein
MSDEMTATVTSVPVAYRGRVLTSGNQTIALVLFTLQVILTLVLSLVPALLSVPLAQMIAPNNKELSFLPILVGMGVTGLLLWLLVGRALRHPWSSAYMFSKTRAEFQQRPDPIVDPANPDAILVEVIPRRNWTQAGLGSSEDMGFMLVDSERRRLLFEGDNRRYQIPIPALDSCEVEIVNEDSQRDQRSIPVAVVVLKFREPELGEREVPLRPMRTVGGDPLGGNYVERANELHRRIASLSDE